LNKNSYTPAEYADVAVMLREAGMNMLARLDLVALQPRRILDVSCRTGFCTQQLRERYPNADIFAVDPDAAMLEYAQQAAPALSVDWICADSAKLPLRGQAVDLIVANLCVPWCVDLKKLLREWRRVLRPEGLLMFTSLGPDTLVELQAQDVRLPHFPDMHDLGDELVQAGFADPVLDVEHFTLQYRNWEQLLYELRVTKMIDTLPAPSDVPPLAVTYEVVYGHAWGPAVSDEYSADQDGLVRIPLSHLRGRR
jgi:malonyl-CoA O-methyltransferase